MKPRKQTIFIMLLGLLLVAFAVAMAQDPKPPAQGDQSHAESCCSMESCCTCCGESCDMSKHDPTMKHDANMKHDMKGHKGDCCNIKKKSKKA